MKLNDVSNNFGEHAGVLAVKPPFIWPDARIHAGLACYEEHPPARRLSAGGDLISGVLVGAADEAVRWLDELLHMEGKRRICLVLVLVPAGPTRERHLRAIDTLQASLAGSEKTLDVRLLPMARHFEGDCERVGLPPTVIQAHNTQTGRTVMSIGSVGDSGCDKAFLGSLNFVLHPDDAVRDAWRRWFQYIMGDVGSKTLYGAEGGCPVDPLPLLSFPDALKRDVGRL